MTKTEQLILMLVERGVATVDKDDAAFCCGMRRDYDGFCRHREHHPIYLGNWIARTSLPEA